MHSGSLVVGRERQIVSMVDYALATVRQMDKLADVWTDNSDRPDTQIYKNPNNIKGVRLGTACAFSSTPYRDTA